MDKYFEIPVNKLEISETQWANYLLGVIAQFNKEKKKIRESKVKEEKAESERVIPETPSEESTSTIERLKREALGDAVLPEKKKKEKPSEGPKYNITELELLNVHQLRRFARGVEEFPIKGREISRANRTELLDYFNTLLKK